MVHARGGLHDVRATGCGALDASEEGSPFFNLTCGRREKTFLSPLRVGIGWAVYLFAFFVPKAGEFFSTRRGVSSLHAGAIPRRFNAVGVVLSCGLCGAVRDDSITSFRSRSTCSEILTLFHVAFGLDWRRKNARAIGHRPLGTMRRLWWAEVVVGN